MADHDDALPVEPSTFDQIMDEHEAPAPEPSLSEPEGEGAAARTFNRDASGKFAKAAEPAPEAEAAPQAEPAKPAAPEPQRFTADEWHALTAKFQPAQPAAPKQPEPEAPKPPEFWEDPRAAVQHQAQELLSPVEQRIQRVTLFYSQRSAVQEFGQETVQKAIGAIAELQKANPAEYRRLDGLAAQSMDPVGDLVRWHKRTEAMKAVGDDPDAFAKNRIKELAANPELRAALLAELGFAEAAPSPNPNPPQRQPIKPALPPSLSKAPAGMSLPADDDMSDEARFNRHMPN